MSQAIRSLEMATNRPQAEQSLVAETELIRVETPNCKTIDEVAAFLQVSEGANHQALSSIHCR